MGRKDIYFFHTYLGNSLFFYFIYTKVGMKNNDRL